MSLGACFKKKFHLVNAYIASKLALFSVSGLKDENLIKKTNLHEN